MDSMIPFVNEAIDLHGQVEFPVDSGVLGTLAVVSANRYASAHNIEPFFGSGWATTPEWHEAYVSALNILEAKNRLNGEFG